MGGKDNEGWEGSTGRMRDGREGTREILFISNVHRE